ncbi:response regulator [Halorubrum vacuolatum]|uniref:Two-component system, chemotaxis family, response regulator CheY n=1 Tax=Halorubrum vacuolatum TaxID=63740 RepID=A0A238UWJ1_HALVU|nr:response regulator [Halorubrum vacuolatum]SNR26378.1 two-component system, chemotaxis family, response regulator CheY [Halorubrum vacuolatum]
MSKRILVVDDSAFQRTVVRDALEDEFEVVAEAENGEEAVAMFEEHAPDGISMDIVMPEMTGIEATATIKKRSPGTTVVMCTSVDQEEKMMEAVKAGADGYVTKPVDGTKLLEEFNTHLG